MKAEEERLREERRFEFERQKALEQEAIRQHEVEIITEENSLFRI